jgi:hypothetical protein
MHRISSNGKRRRGEEYFRRQGRHVQFLSTFSNTLEFSPVLVRTNSAGILSPITYFTFTLGPFFRMSEGATTKHSIGPLISCVRSAKA